LKTQIQQPLVYKCCKRILYLSIKVRLFDNTLNEIINILYI